MQMVVLGSGERQFEDLFRAMAARYPEKFAVRVAYDEALAHKIEAGADMFLMPSRYEPCGLNQFYSLKYGTPPIVRATGGLEDTVENWNWHENQGTGFKFSEYTPYALLETVRWALRTFHYPESWRTLMLNGMSRDFSWDRSAEQYQEVYQRVRGLRRYWTGG
jgi:starch synthase